MSKPRRVSPPAPPRQPASPARCGFLLPGRAPTAPGPARRGERPGSGARGSGARVRGDHMPRLPGGAGRPRSRLSRPPPPPPPRAAGRLRGPGAGTSRSRASLAPGNCGARLLQRGGSDWGSGAAGGDGRGRAETPGRAGPGRERAGRVPRALPGGAEEPGCPEPRGPVDPGSPHDGGAATVVPPEVTWDDSPGHRNLATAQLRGPWA